MSVIRNILGVAHYERVMLMQPAAIKMAVATKEGTREYFLKR